MKAASQNLSVVLLAGGVSQRFGSNKLVTKVRALPLIETAIRTLESLSPSQKVAVVSSIYQSELKQYFDSSWKIPVQTDPSSQPWDSLQLAKGLLDSAETKSVLVHLADMPFVTKEYLQKMARSPDSLVSRIGQQTTPPFILTGKDCDWFGYTQKDFRRALGGLESVEAPPEFFRDIDTKEDLVGLDGTSGRT